MQTAIVIPARLESTRFPGKALVRIKGKSLVQYAIDAAKQSKLADAVLLATGNRAIVEDGEPDPDLPVCLMGGNFRNGTERAAAAIAQMEWTPQQVVVLQCDEPDLTGADIDRLIEQGSETRLATMAHRGCQLTTGWNEVKVVCDRRGDSVHFSRAPMAGAMLHVGAYLIGTDILANYAKAPPLTLEKAEQLEQLRFLEYDQARFRVVDVGRPVRSINVPGDLDHFAEQINVTEKPWGRSIDLGHGLHKIIVNPRGRCSIHKHARKFNQFILADGRFAVSTWPDGGLVADSTHVLGDGAMPLTIAPGVTHQFADYGDGFTAYESYWTADGSEPDADDIERMEEAPARC